MPTAVVAHRAPDALGQSIQIGDQFVDTLPLQVRVPLEGGVQLGDVGRVVLAMVDAHRLFINVRCEGIEIVRQARKLVRHEGISFETWLKYSLKCWNEELVATCRILNAG